MSTQRMSSADAAWLHMDRDTNLMVVNSLLWFEEPVDHDRVRQILRERLIEPFPRFRQRVSEPRLAVGTPSWEDDPRFDLDRHVHHRALPAPGDKRALEALLSDLVVVPLDRSKPLWQIYLVDGFGTGTAMIARIHHCIADGIALSRVLLSLTDTQPHAGIAPARDGSGRGLLEAMIAPIRAGGQLVQAGVGEGIEQIEQQLLDVFAQKTSAVMTNVAGPRQPVYFAGSKIAGVVPWVPAAGTIGMGMSIFSYDGAVTVGLQVDAGLIPDPDAIIVDYEHEIATLAHYTSHHPQGSPALAPLDAAAVGEM